MKDILRELRVTRGLSQTQLAAKLDISRSAYSMYESGARLPSVATLMTMAEVLSVSIDYLLGLTAHPDRTGCYSGHEIQVLRQLRGLDERSLELLAHLAGCEAGRHMK